MTLRSTLLAAFLLVAGALAAQQFPQSFTGHWKGELQWYRQGTPEPKKVLMQLIIQPTDTAGQYTWQLVYGEGSTDNRPYVLKAVDSTLGHWVVDERNSILLHHYFAGGQLSCAFTVSGNTIVTNYKVSGAVMEVEFRSFGTKPVATTGGTGPDIPPVDSYNIRSYQRAILHKQMAVKR